MRALGGCVSPRASFAKRAAFGRRTRRRTRGGREQYRTDSRARRRKSHRTPHVPTYYYPTRTSSSLQYFFSPAKNRTRNLRRSSRRSSSPVSRESSSQPSEPEKVFALAAKNRTRNLHCRESFRSSIRSRVVGVFHDDNPSPTRSPRARHWVARVGARTPGLRAGSGRVAPGAPWRVSPRRRRRAGRSSRHSKLRARRKPRRRRCPSTSRSRCPRLSRSRHPRWSSRRRNRT